ncbi:hypothetical protein MUS1_10540 [Marinomonas ushuaiensis DSM 15871]|uniref:C-type lysozyme inhibitor domain-containing protein n=1 Tax=Marinomonas ushuaiensis DSM 15871 TaxID=1122207 RepID=X7E6E9_9GAMM|nr:MliC family protein [Marinomonas ushuaiensis]ETX11395.1 hypothetical protein MUS1_10540 [Marinomonas ushuaiensis DSM 15871]
MQIKTLPLTILFLKKLLIISSVVVITACSSSKKEDFFDEKNYEIDDVVQTNSAVYSCDNHPLGIFFHAEQAQINWKDKTYKLNHAVSASGAFYLGEGISFWIHDNKAELALNNMDKTACRLIRVDS